MFSHIHVYSPFSGSVDFSRAQLIVSRNGPSEFFVSGTLKTWSIVDEVHKIEVPTLLINGRYDEAQDEVVEPFFKNIKKVKWVRFAQSSHMPHMEEPEEFMEVVQNFIAD